MPAYSLSPTRTAVLLWSGLNVSISISCFVSDFKCSCRFAAFDSNKDVVVNGKPVRTKADSLAFLCHEVSVAVLNDITTQRMMRKND